MWHRARIMLLAAGLLVIAADARGDATEELLAAVKRVGPEGRGHVEAAAAIDRLQRKDASVLLPILRSFRDASPLAANWLAGAFESIADRTLETEGMLPEGELEAFVNDRAQSAAARQLAFDWLERIDATARERLIPGMLDDPAPDLRREAVAHHVARARALEEAGRIPDAIAAWREALRGAVHVDQIVPIADALKRHGESVPIREHLGFLTRWRIIGPFEHAGGGGFDAVYPPETCLDFSAEYAGKSGRVAWRTLTTDDDLGVVDIARQIGPYKGAAMYATAEFQSAGQREAEIRLATQNAWKLWVNGELLFSRLEYHRGTAFDQYRVPIRLKAGRNVILLKICQNEQPDEWAQSFQFQLRVCDRSGAGLRSIDRTGPGGERE